MLKEMILVTNFYPTKSDPIYTFIRPVVCGLTELGVHVSVVTPQSLSNTFMRKARLRPRHWVDYSASGMPIDVYQPKYISLSNIKIRDVEISSWLYKRMVKKEVERLHIKADAIYAHFWESVVAAAYAIKESDIPLIAVSGEDKITVYSVYPHNEVHNTVERVNGLICVSTKNLNESEELGLTTEKMKKTVIPNAIDENVFRPMNGSTIREKLGVSIDKPIGVFVGEFSNRKGVNRVLEAAKTIPDLGLILIGSDGELIDSDQIIYAGKLSHHEIPQYLNAANFFVLPTLAEGCCNAIVEAMACGLPIISSNLAFNDDILNQENSIRVNPQSIEEIRNAMETLITNTDLRNKLSRGSLKMGKQLTIDKRARRIKEFIETTMVE